MSSFDERRTHLTLTDSELASSELEEPARSAVEFA